MNPNDLYRAVRDQLLDYTKFEQGLIKIIGYPGYPHGDVVANKKMDYMEWLANYTSYPVIKVEGLEIEVPYFTPFAIKDIHLFVHQKYGQSFKWHKDEVNVYLYVLRGFKRVHVRNKVYNLHPGQGCIIPSGHLHKAVSTQGTWALSIGY